MRLRRGDPHTLVGPHALDSLGERDRARFERHLARCEACRQEARGLREAAARLAAAAASPPPARLRGEVLAAASRTRQLPPSGPPLPRARLVRGPLARRLALAAAASFAAAGLAFGGLALNAHHRLSAQQARSDQIAAVLNAPDATMMTARGASGGSATAVMSHQDRALVLTTAHLPALPSAKAYEVWLLGPGGAARGAGMLPSPRAGMTAPIVVRGLAAGDQVGVTVEPAAGTARPTSPPVLVLNLPP